MYATVTFPNLFLETLAKVGKAAKRFVKCLSACTNSISDGRIFVKFYNVNSVYNLSRKFKFR